VGHFGEKCRRVSLSCVQILVMAKEGLDKLKPIPISKIITTYKLKSSRKKR